VTKKIRRKKIPVPTLEPSEIEYLKENGMWDRWRKSGWTGSGTFRPKK